MKNSIKYKEVEVPNKQDNYGRPLVIKVAKQSDAEQVTDEDSGIKRWTAGAFIDMQINSYIKDEEYNELDDDKLIALAKKLKM